MLTAVQGVRTALLFPVYQEDTARIAATIECIARELVALGAEKRFDMFVLSDSRLGDIKARELRAVRFLRRRLRDACPIYYRCRAQNVGKKAGNIADWVQRFGGAYESFIILDADSIMSGGLLVHLQSLMAAQPKAGLIQTVPRLVGAETLFARLQQFAVAFYGPVVAAGFAAWYQHSGNYWGHNAIVRTRAFADAAGLPNLPGRPPLGGHVLSHDFVEAAYLRRAGWQVSMRPDLLGSYEGCPPTLIDVAVRDRRWAQGNVQHLRIVGTRGLPWLSRVHLGMGAYAYFSSALWALSLLVGVILSLQSAYTLPVYFPDAKTLFPVWPVIDPTKAFYLFLVTLAVLLLPKVFGITMAVLRSADAAAPSGRGQAAGWLPRRDAVLDPDRADPDADADARHLRDPHRQGFRLVCPASRRRRPRAILAAAVSRRPSDGRHRPRHRLPPGVDLRRSLDGADHRWPAAVGRHLACHIQDGAQLARQGSGNS